MEMIELLRAIKDLVQYTQASGVKLSESSYKIFCGVERICWEENICPFYEDYLVSLIENVPKLYDSILALGGNPEIVKALVFRDHKHRMGIPYEEANAYSIQKNRNLYARTAVLDFIILKKKQDRAELINEIDVIEAVLDCYERDFPIFGNSTWTDSRLQTPFNTVAHMVGVYSDELWVKLDSIREAMGIIDKGNILVK
jgi:hypothetical protein